ncbi:SAM-dependent methyltransferase [Cordyceps militaris CM01]|uniref:SAM-dependent methyltransferase n=1 Tax=Cordyceps militaris (strain CM01) TaxID=983644 RepID=G3JI17_CORMM|nr:SAM-dependent methyltransferase [Cordyceps militaris CM01]EGX91820.1 SAM-dependent methyltransferase [Cordyceps militaris CM01]
MAAFTPISLDTAESIARYSPTPNDTALQIEKVQVEHRLQLINAWRIPPGSTILEIGCGQGTCTTVLATAAGPNGHVDAVDPGPPDYGSPYTLAQAQAIISAGTLGDRITWHNAEPTDVLATSGDKVWDYAVFSHCIWYFDNRDVLSTILRAMQGRVGAVLVAEYALTATERDAQPHLLSAIARAALEAHNPSSTANIRCLLSPAGIKEIAEASGLKVGDESIIVPAAGLLDGVWESGEVRSKSFVDEVGKRITSPRVKEMLLSSREAVIASHAAMNGRKTRTMDVWVASFTPVE